MSPPLPRPIARGRRVVIALLVVSALAGAVTVVWLLVLLVPLLTGLLPSWDTLL